MGVLWQTKILQETISTLTPATQWLGSLMHWFPLTGPSPAYSEVEPTWKRYYQSLTSITHFISLKLRLGVWRSGGPITTRSTEYKDRKVSIESIENDVEVRLDPLAIDFSSAHKLAKANALKNEDIENLIVGLLKWMEGSNPTEFVEQTLLSNFSRDSAERSTGGGLRREGARLQNHCTEQVMFVIKKIPLVSL